jgi:hypothetical protein
VPVAMLKDGLNSVQISAENDDPEAPDSDDATAPLAVDHMICQFDYTEAAAATPAVAPTLTPTAPTAPDDTGPMSPDANGAATPETTSSIPSDDLLTVPIPAKP